MKFHVAALPAPFVFYAIITDKEMETVLQKNILNIAFMLALLSILGSLFFSEVMHFAPCILCWYQRICMYPLVPILVVGIIRKEKSIPWYVLPLSIIGMTIALYHTLLYYHILPESIAPCTTSVSCTTKYIELFGFISIPFLSFLAFSGITACMIIYMKGFEK